MDIVLYLHFPHNPFMDVREKKSQLIHSAILLFACLHTLCVPKITNAEVKISGVDKTLRNNILSYMQIDEETCDAAEGRIRYLFKQTDEQIEEALEVTGYYNANVEKNLDLERDCWLASYVITPGNPVLLRTVTIDIESGSSDIKPDSVITDAAKKCDLKTGDVLHHGKYESCTRRINQIATSLGYFSAIFDTRRIDVYPQQDAADITVSYVTGPRYVFGETTFEHKTLDHNLIKRFVTIQPGEPYDATKVRHLQRDLIASSYFDQVLFQPSPRGEPYFDVPIHVTLTPGKKYQYSAGIGFATDVGPKLRFGILNRRINSSGHQVEFNTNISQVISEADISYRIPLDKPRDWFTFDTGYKREENDSFNSERFTTGVQRVQQAERDWIRTLFLNYSIEDYEAGRSDDGITRLLTPGISYTFIGEDYPPRPLSGHHSSVSLLGAAKSLASDTSFAQIYGSTKWAFRLWWGARLLPRAEMGFTLIDELDTLPATMRYFAGGDTSVRGYGYNTLGPTDEFGEVVGGENLIVGSIELDQMIASEWSAAIFIDSGNAYNALSEFDPATGIGAGIRWYSPLGPIRFDVAVPLEDDAPDDYRIHITLGPDL